MPVATSMSGQGVIPDAHTCHVGTTGVVGTEPGNYALKNADVLISFGSQFPEMDASSWREGYFPSFPPCKLIRVDLSLEKLIIGIEADVAIQADAKVALDLIFSGLSTKTSLNWSEWIEEIANVKAKWFDSLQEIRSNPVIPFEPAFLLTKLREIITPDSIVVSGVGVRHSIAQHFPIHEPRSLVVASGFGTMGQEVGAAIGAKLAMPDRPVVAIIGDGALLACLAALPTAAALQLPLTWIVLDNGGYASISVYQAKHFNRFSATFFESSSGDKYRPDYVKLGESFGIHSYHVETLGDLDEYLKLARSTMGPSMIIVPVSQKPRNFGTGHWDVNYILANVDE
jgi:acetolactate synthase-1/2/3 large subunit